MTRVDLLLAELTRETQTTRTQLERLPGDRIVRPDRGRPPVKSEAR